MPPTVVMSMDLDVDIWELTPNSLNIELDCLLPNGVIVQLTVPKNITLADLKNVSIQ